MAVGQSAWARGLTSKLYGMAPQRGGYAIGPAGGGGRRGGGGLTADEIRQQRARARAQPQRAQQPRFGEYPTLTRQQQSILSELMRGRGTAQFGGRAMAPVGVSPIRGLPTAERPTYAPIGLPGAGERGAALSRMMGVSPEEERLAIERMAQPAMRQFREEILPGIRGGAAATGTMWSTMRAGEEARAGAGLSERLAGMGEQYRMARRGQAMQAAGLGAQEALGGAQLGMQQYGTQMQQAMLTQQLGGQAALQTQRLGAQAGLQAQQLGAETGWRRQQMLAQLLGIPMMGVYSY